ncbi:MAG: fused MFS/spermidine synthase [Verrucomicrobiota bacterium]|nr:fused MFS/spermidine synthase [Verrucomicrobiota bacterium]
MMASMVRLVVFALGISSVVAQLTLLRELLAAFHGNELALGVFLGNWLLLTGVGAAMGRRAKGGRRGERRLILGQLWIAVTPVLGLLALRVLRDTIFLRGAEVGAPAAMFGSLVVLGPYCLMSGYLLTLAVALLSHVEGDKGLGTVYVADSIGSVIGGLAFTFVLTRWLDHFAILWCVGWLGIIVAAYCGYVWRKERTTLVWASIAAAWVVVGISGVDDWSTRRQFPGQEIVFAGNSPYGRVILTRADGQLNLSASGVATPLAADPARVEETVLCALAQRPDARHVLLLGGGVTGTGRLLLDHGVGRVTYVELDPLVLELGRRFLPGNVEDPRIEVLATDGRRHLRSTTKRYDIVIIDTPDPVTSQLNRLYTVEFFACVKKVLNLNGVIAFGLSRYENTVSPELERILATAHRTLREVFGRVLMLPLGRVFFVASDGELCADVAERLSTSPGQIQWMRTSYLRAMLSEDRMSDMQRAALAPAMLNTDFRPVLYFLHLRHWLSQFGKEPTVFVVLLAVAIALYVWRLGTVSRAVLASGVAASSLEVALLLAVQVACGALYQQLGFVVAVFMAGLAMGGWLGREALWLSPKRSLGRLVTGIGLYAVVLPWALQWIAGGAGGVVGMGVAMGWFLFLTAILAVLVGAVFPVAGRALAAEFVSSASRLYTADFVGAWLGAVLAGAVLIPVIGVTGMCRAVAVFVIACGIAVLAAKRVK